MGEIRTSHLEEPGIAEATYRLLYAAGLVAPPDAAGKATPNPLQSVPADVAATPEAGGIWTPEREAAGPAEGEEKSVIWTP